LSRRLYTERPRLRPRPVHQRGQGTTGEATHQKRGGDGPGEDRVRSGGDGSRGRRAGMLHHPHPGKDGARGRGADLVEDREHRLDRGDEPDRGECLRPLRRPAQGPDQPPVDVDRAPAHPLRNPPGVADRLPAHPHHDEVALSARFVDHPEDIDVELADHIVRHHRLPDPGHPGPYLVQEHELRSIVPERGRSEYEDPEPEHQPHHPSVHHHRSSAGASIARRFPCAARSYASMIRATSGCRTTSDLSR